MPEMKAEIIAWLLSTAIPVIGLYITNKTKIKESEHRQTVLEMQVHHLEEKVNHNAVRLDGHDEQNRIMFQLVEQVGTLTERVDELRADVKQIGRSR